MASSEISVKMTAGQIKAVLIGLLISEGMMIPGNIPNIVCAGKLTIKSNEWIKLGVPLGL
jgi:predicted cation transporter